jgi:hypothetical protein
MTERKREPGEVFCRMREGKVAYFLQMPDGEAFNIWDLEPEETTPAVDKMIEAAVARGVELASRLMRRSLQDGMVYRKGVDRSALPELKESKRGARRKPAPERPWR